jgi:acetylornithine deacetylase/succinyl-diaminopimelate desuccinylase family protein
MTISSGEINELVSLVDESRLVKDLASMVSTPSVNPFDDPTSPECREQEFAETYLERMNSIGMDTFKRDVLEGRPNVFGRRHGSGGGPTVMLAGHLDTVGVEGYRDPFNPVVKNGRLYGRGSCDMKAALAAYIEVARIIEHSGLSLKGDLVVAGIADEEHLMLGSKDVSKNGPIPDFAIVGEPTELMVCHAHKGQMCMHIKTFGKASHSSVPENGINAINHMADVIKKLDEYSDELLARPAHPVCGHGRVTPCVIKGGSISSSVPDYCELEIDRRTLAGETQETVTEEYKQLLDSLSKSNPDFKYEIGDPTLDNAPLDTPVDSAVVTRIAQAYEEVLGKPADVGAFPAATDAPHFLCPAVVCGPGSINQAHTLDEYVSIDELTASARIYLRTVLNMLS